MTQAELASRLNEYLDEDDRVSPQAVSNWETGRNMPSRRSLRALELVHDLPAGTLSDFIDPLEFPDFTGSPGARSGAWAEFQKAQAEVARIGYELNDAVQRMRDAAERLHVQTEVGETDAVLRESALMVEILERASHTLESDSTDDSALEPMEDPEGGDDDRPSDDAVG